MAWPIGDGGRRLTVELSGLPIFDRDRVFRGYRGFGVCRDVAPPVETPAPVAAPAEVTAAENVLPFRPSAPEAPAAALNAVERSAFCELARRLTERLGEAVGAGPADAEGAAQGEPAAPEPVEPLPVPAGAVAEGDQLIGACTVTPALPANPRFYELFSSPSSRRRPRRTAWRRRQMADNLNFPAV